MIEETLSPFHAELATLLAKERGGDPALEQKLFASLSKQQFEAAGLGPFCPRIYRGLPRLYRRVAPYEARVKRGFRDLGALRKRGVERAIFSLYREVRLRRGARVALLTWVMADGLGDFFAARKVAELFQREHPEIEVEQVVLVPKRLAPLPESSVVKMRQVVYEGECPPTLLDAKSLFALRFSDWILQLPTFYPFTRELFEQLKWIEPHRPFPRVDHVGEYGFIESSHFCPEGEGRALGLHFLEQGILLERGERGEKLENRALSEALFGGEEDWERYEKGSLCSLAYLSTEVGGAIYLHALLKWLEGDGRDIDVCTPDLHWFVAHAEGQGRRGRPVLEGEFGVGSLEVHFGGEVHRRELSKGGKRLRLLSYGTLFERDFQLLLERSAPFVAVRGNQSLSEVVSLGKPFFYDAREHSRSFVKDLVALVKGTLRGYPGTVRCFEAMEGALLHQLKEGEGEWVEETFFQERRGWLELAERLGEALKRRETAIGYGQLKGKVADGGEFLLDLLKRGLSGVDEGDLWDRFGAGEIDLPILARGVQSRIREG